VDRKKIRLEEPIRETGTFMVDVEVGGGVTASVKTIVAEACRIAAQIARSRLRAPQAVIFSQARDLVPLGVTRTADRIQT
jgi:hypothetical protein